MDGSPPVRVSIDPAGPRLITCGGEFDRTSGQHRDNIVGWAVPRP